jgi:Xaa-Pro aminopeptidase
MDQNFYKQNRERLLEQLRDNSLLVLFSGKLQRRTADDFYSFLANRNFVYLTGISMENFGYVAAKRDGQIIERLYIEEPDELKEAWTGRRMRVEEAQETSGIGTICFIDHLLVDLHQYFMKGPYRNVFVDLDVLSPDQPHTLEQQFAGKLRSDYPQVVIDSVYPILRKMRTYKSSDEIANIRKAVKLTGEGFVGMVTSCRPGMKEFELEAEFKYILAKAGCREPAFKPIVSAGQNNFYLHYDKPYGVIGSEDLVLCDIGAVVDGYCADISRVFPASGRFNNQQRAIYEAALAGVKAAQAVGKPGCTFDAFNQAAREVVQEHLARLGLVRKPEDLKKYMWHGLAHHIGLDVHDVGIYEVPMAQNMVFSLDVGIYVKEWNVGLRIEDDVVVTSTGMENLAEVAGIPKEGDELEALLKINCHRLASTASF